MLFAATGHRPGKLGPRFNPCRLRAFAVQQLEALQATGVISGLAQGWDTAVAFAAIDLDIRLIAAVPFEGQADRWSEQDQKDYRFLRQMASQVHVMSPLPRVEAYRQRDYWMVDHGAAVLALYNGSPGGTKITVEYAERRDRPILNLWDAWTRFAR